MTKKETMEINSLGMMGGEQKNEPFWDQESNADMTCEQTVRISEQKNNQAKRVRRSTPGGGEMHGLSTARRGGRENPQNTWEEVQAEETARETGAQLLPSLTTFCWRAEWRQLLLRGREDHLEETHILPRTHTHTHRSTDTGLQAFGL